MKSMIGTYLVSTRPLSRPIGAYLVRSRLKTRVCAQSIGKYCFQRNTLKMVFIGSLCG